MIFVYKYVSQSKLLVSCLTKVIHNNLTVSEIIINLLFTKQLVKGNRKLFIT